MEAWKTRNQRNLKFALGIIRWVPFSRGVALTGSLAEGRETKNSDIDFFIQVKEGRIWSTRLLITVILLLLGIARTDNRVAGQVCLNWYATYDAPGLQQGRIHTWLWRTGDQLPLLKSFFESLGSGYLGNIVENLLKKYQISRIERDPRTHLPQSEVRYSDTELGFHPHNKQ